MLAQTLRQRIILQGKGSVAPTAMLAKLMIDARHAHIQTQQARPCTDDKSFVSQDGSATDTCEAVRALRSARFAWLYVSSTAHVTLFRCTRGKPVERRVSIVCCTPGCLTFEFPKARYQAAAKCAPGSPLRRKVVTAFDVPVTCAVVLDWQLAFKTWIKVTMPAASWAAQNMQVTQH